MFVGPISEALKLTSNQFFERGTHQDVVEAIRTDEANFLDGEKTIMYRVE